MVEGQEILQELETAIIENIREEVSKDKGNKKQLQIVKDIIKQNKKENSFRPALLNYHPFVYNGIVYKGFTNTYYIVASQDDFNYTEEKLQ